MGAAQIDYLLDGKKTEAELAAWLESQQARDASDASCDDDEGGDASYAGDTRTVRWVKLVDRTFTNLTQALAYCLEHAEKHDHLVAVYYQNKAGKMHTLVCGWAAQ